VSNSEIILDQLTNGNHDDNTAAAALDALREDCGLSLLAAVIEVAKAYHTGRTARDIAEANGYLSLDSPVRNALKEAIEFNCLNLPEGAYATTTVVDGDQPPSAVDNSIDSGTHVVALASVTVGALWVKREANRIMLERERAARRPRRRRSN